MLKITFPSFLDFLQLASLPFVLQPQHEMILYSAVHWQQYWLDEVTVIFLPVLHWMNAEKLIHLPELQMLNFIYLLHNICKAEREKIMFKLQKVSLETAFIQREVCHFDHSVKLYNS